MLFISLLDGLNAWLTLSIATSATLPQQSMEYATSE